MPPWELKWNTTLKVADEPYSIILNQVEKNVF